MIISPPFLPARVDTQSESAWLDAAFGQTPPLRETNAPAGSYPLGIGLAWHNGLHIQGAANADNQTPVYAIADGEVLHIELPRCSNADPGDAQNFNPFPGGATWTDNGLMILRHQTEIGANGDQPTTLTYFSTYMHLNQIGRITPAGQQTARQLQSGDRVYRKDEIGKAGQIYGHAGQIHLEICLDDDNLQRLIGRPPAWVDPANIPVPTADGRIDAVFGAIWFYLPATTPTSTTAPTNHLRAAAQTTLGQALWVRMHYESGNTRFEVYDSTGRLLGQRPETNGEYELYRTASNRHQSLAATDQARSSPSGWYELLRFGRNLGRGPNLADKDPLPANVAHWRQICINGQDIWADLNTEGSYKFSDADFLPIQGWNFIDDDSTPNDQRCDSNRLKNLIADPDPNAPDRLATATLEPRLGDPAVMRKLRRMFCRFPSEWDGNTMATRYGFVRELPAFQNAPGAWNDFEAHLNALTFTGLLEDYQVAQWRVHPKEFIGWMRQCGWLNLDELAQLVPRRGVANCVGTWDSARDRWLNRVGYINLNRVFCKYALTTVNRQTAFLAQAYIETGCLRTITEDGNGNHNPALPMTQYYAAFYGRGLMQLTWAGTYADYGKYRGFSEHNGAYADPRITANSVHDWGPPEEVNGRLRRDQRRWAARFDPVIVASNTYNACDSGAFFWVQKRFTGTSNINRLADEGLGAELTGRISVLVNGGGNGYNERLQYAAFIERYRGDEAETVQAGTITATRQGIYRGQWRTIGNGFRLNVNYTPQRP